MQIVIDMTEDFYKLLMDNEFDKIRDINLEYIDLVQKIKNGTLLPKGHGDLIDRTEVIKSLFDYHNGKKTIGQCIDDVPTTIEADKEEEE